MEITLESSLDEIDAKVESVKKTALGAQSAASTTSNKLDNFKRKNLSLN